MRLTGRFKREEKASREEFAEGLVEDPMRGALSGIGSRDWKDRVDNEGLEAGRTGFTADGLGACLPKGGFETLIQAFESFEGLLGWAWDALRKIRRGMREQSTMARGAFNLPKAKDDIFPLPVSQAEPLALRCTVSALNDLSGYGPNVAEPDLTAF